MLLTLLSAAQISSEPITVISNIASIRQKFLFPKTLVFDQAVTGRIIKVDCYN